MEIHFAYNDKHSNMFETYCKPSIPYGLTIIEHKSNIESIAEYMKYGYMDIIREKMSLILDSLKPDNSNDPIIWCDADIIFNTRYRRNFITALISEFKNSKKSILYQRESTTAPEMINAGFFIAKRNDFTRNLYSFILKSCLERNDMHDQDYINRFIIENESEAKINIGTLPLTYASASNGGFNMIKRCQLFHCNCTKTLDDKIKMMQIIKSKM
jgi:hypothetical protein